VEKNTVTIPFVRRLNTTGTASLVQSDRARARFLKNGRGGSSLKATVPDAIFGVPSTNQVVDYVISASDRRTTNTGKCVCFRTLTVE